MGAISISGGGAVVASFWSTTGAMGLFQAPIGLHRCHSGCCNLYLDYCSLSVGYAGGMWDGICSMETVVGTVWSIKASSWAGQLLCMMLQHMCMILDVCEHYLDLM